MKRILLFTLVVLTLIPMSARNITINVSTVQGDLTQQLRSQCAQARNSSDTVFINFDKAGTYTICGSIKCRGSIVIKGQGRDKSTLVFDKGSDHGDFKAFTADAFFEITGTQQRPVGVWISDISFKLKDHNGIWWDKAEKYAIKIDHADPVDIRRVNSYMSNAVITNFDIKVSSNVTVTDCNVTNYNNCHTGGCIWVRGEMHNVKITNNTIRKYGNDEAVAIFDRVVKVSGYVRGVCNRSDITIENNEFYYGYDGKDKDKSIKNDMIFSVITDHYKSKDCCTTSDFALRNNKFFINDICNRCLYISFDPADKHKNFVIQGNQIVNANLKNSENYYRQDIEVNDLSSNPDTIYLTNNTVKNSDVVVNKYGSNGYTFLLMQGGNVCMQGNTIQSTTGKSSAGKTMGVQLLWCGVNGGEVTLRRNTCKGLKYIATVKAGDGIDKFKITATGNYFQGDTRIYCDDVKECNLNFTRNTFVSDNMNFFLQEFASRGSLIFNNNSVTVTGGNGQLMTHWSNDATSSMRFTKLEVQGNSFKGVSSERNLLKNITSKSQQTVRNNSFSN